jgi:hypothetical protein
VNGLEVRPEGRRKIGLAGVPIVVIVVLDPGTDSTGTNDEKKGIVLEWKSMDLGPGQLEGAWVSLA